MHAVLQETLALTDNITTAGMKFLTTTSMFFTSLGGITTDVLELGGACLFYGTLGLCSSTFSNVVAIVNPSDIEAPDEVSYLLTTVLDKLTSLWERS